MPKSLEEKFLSKVNKTDTCWLWTGATFWKGYGQLRLLGKLVYAHRISWELYKGPIPEGSCVLHKCDITLCVNPEHLFLGSRLDNMLDRSLKGRNRSGRDKLTKEQVVEIRESILSRVELARLYNVWSPCISRIRHNTRWAVLPQ